MDDIFKEHSKCIRIYIGHEVEIDPYEHNTEVSLLSPTNIKGIITDLTATQANWKMPGIKFSQVKDLLIEKKHRRLLELSQKIELQDGMDIVSYEGWRVNGRMQIREEGNYLRVYIYRS